MRYELDSATTTKDIAWLQSEWSLESGTIAADPMFTDVAGEDFTVTNSVVIEHGFV